MGLKSGQEWAGLIVCKDDTGALSTPSVGPVGALYVNGTVNAASVTISGSNPYKWTVTLPALTAGDLVSMYVTATIDSVATAEVVAEDVADTYRTSDIEALVDDIGTAGAGLTAIPWNAAWDAEVQSKAADAITAASLPTAAQIADAVWDEASTGHTDAGKAGQQIWTDVDAILTDTNELQTDNVPGLIAALPTDADVQTAAAAALTAYDPPTKAELDAADDAVLAAIAELNDIDSTVAQAAAAAALAAYDAATATDVTNATSALATSAALATVDSNVDAILLDTGTDGVLVSTTGLTAIAAAVWDALTSGLTTVGSIGAYILTYLDAKVSEVGGGTPASIAASIWDYLTSAATTAGSLGALVVTKLGYLTSGTTVTVSSPVASGLNVTTIQGDDYEAADGRSLDWDVSTTATVTGGTISVVLSGVDTYTGSVVDADTVRLELTAAETAAIPVGKRKYQVILTDTNSDIATLVEGTWTSNARVSE